MNEEVMVVRTEDLRPFLDGRPFDLIREETAAILQLIERAHFFIARAEAEVSPQYRQIIPYVVARHAGDVFVLTRTAKQNEARLHHKISIGIGGHINPGHDLPGGLRKELEEEVFVDTPYELRFAGIINDESTDVGRVHLGAVYELFASTPAVRVRETEKMTGEWRPRAALGALRDAMETWSQIAYDALLR